MNVLLAYNPHAGSFRAELVKQLGEKLSAMGFTVHESDSHNPDLKKLAADCQHLCVIGGDGTLRDVIASVARANPSITFSQFPLGTINLVAREAGYKKDVDALVERIVGRDASKNYHIARTGDDIFLACASVGPDAWSVDRVSLKMKKRVGRLAYAAAFVSQFINWKRQTLHVQADGVSFTAEAAYILKGRYFAGPWTLSETAALTNPKLSILLLATARRRDFLRLMLSVMVSPKLGPADCTRLECSEVTITSDTEAPVQADGDIVGQLPVRISASEDTVQFA